MTTPVAASSAVNHLAVGTFPVSLPAGTADNDLLIAINASDADTLANNDVPSGFTGLTTSQYSAGVNVHLAIGYRIAASEPSSYTFNSGTNSDNVGMLIRITGADTTPVIAQVAATHYTGALAQTVSVPTPGASDDLVIVGIVGDGPSGITFTWDSSCTEINHDQSTSWTTLSVAYSDTSGTYIATPDMNTPNGVTFAISILAAAGGGGTDSGPNSPSTGTDLGGGTGSWSNPGHVTADDGSAATWAVV